MTVYGVVKEFFFNGKFKFGKEHPKSGIPRANADSPQFQSALRWSPAGWRAASTARWVSYLRTTWSSCERNTQMSNRVIVRFESKQPDGVFCGVLPDDEQGQSTG